MYNIQKRTVRLTMLAIFIAFSAVGANVKFMGSIAFDSCPAFLAAMLIGGPEGAIVGAAGHLFSAMLAGFPLTVPMHLAIAGEMALICGLTGWLIRKKHWPLVAGSVVAFVLNALVSPLLVLVWPGMGWAMFWSLLPVLAVASAANVVVASLLAVALKKPYAMLQRTFQ